MRIGCRASTEGFEKLFLADHVIRIVRRPAGTFSPALPGAALRLAGYVRQHISHVKAPRVIDFMKELPRHATGKLYKRLIRDAYWGKSNATIV